MPPPKPVAVLPAIVLFEIESVPPAMKLVPVASRRPFEMPPPCVAAELLRISVRSIVRLASALWVNTPPPSNRALLFLMRLPNTVAVVVP